VLGVLGEANSYTYFFLICRVAAWSNTLIAGIALAREAQLATRNLRHFDDTTISLINPFGG